MPNWCYTDYRFEGKDATKLFNLIDSYINSNASDLETDFGSSWLGNIVVGAGLATKEEVVKGDIPCRGYVADYSIDRDTIYLSTETAWVSMPLMWFLIRNKFELDISISFLSEESGCECYERYDEIGTFADCDYCVDSCIEYCDKDTLGMFDVDYSTDEQTVRACLIEFFNKMNIDFSEEASTDSLISLFENECEEYISEDSYVSIHKYYDYESC